MAYQLKRTIISILPLYMSKESEAFVELKNAITSIPEDKFNKLVNQASSNIGQRVHQLLDDVIFFINRHCQIKEQEGLELDSLISQIKHICLDLMSKNQIMDNKISLLEDRIKILENDQNTLKNDQNTLKKLRTTAEILTPVVRDIRSSITNERIPDNYYSRTVINACLLHLDGKNISWEISDFNMENPQLQFELNKFNQVELIIRNYADNLRVNYRTLLDFLRLKFDQNENEHESIKKILRSNAPINNVSFNEYLNSIDMVNIFNVNEKICLEAFYRTYFLSRYH